MNRDQFKAKLMAAVGPGDYEKVFRAVREQMRSLDEARRFEILFHTAAESQSMAPSCPAAQLLRELSPKCPLTCLEALGEDASRHGHLLDGCARRVLSAVVRCHNSVGAPGPCRLTHALG